MDVVSPVTATKQDADDPTEPRSLRPAHARRFKRAIDELNTLRDEIAAYIPDANWYLAMESLNLMSGPSHAGYGDRAQKQNVICSHNLYNSGGGDW